MNRNKSVKDRYYNYLTNRVCDGYSHSKNDYDRLFHILDSIEFYAVIDNDNNRIADACEMRAEFELNDNNRCYIIDGFISVFEVMVALAIRCEESIMGDIEYGDRTPDWFWYMIQSMELEGETNSNLDEIYVIEQVQNMLERNFTRDGQGSLFYIPGCLYDMRDTEIWYQMNHWLETVE